MSIHKELMESWKWNPIHSYRNQFGAFYVCPYFCLLLVVLVCVGLNRKFVSIVSMPCGPTKIIMLD